MQFKDYYDILGVDAKAEQDEIRRAYRKLARKYHPDVSSEDNAEDQFKDVSEAYEVLKDPEKRAAYDQVHSQRHGGAAGGDWQPPPSGSKFDFGTNFGGGGFTGADAAGFSDFFETLFGSDGRSGRPYAARGDDHRAVIRIDLDTAFRGGSRKLNLQEPVRGADGQVRMRNRSLNVKIPAGVTDGQQIRLRGQGTLGSGGGEAGDILLEVTVEPHSEFTLEGRDLHHSLAITPWEAALGATVKLPTLDGKVDMKIPPGSQSGKRLRLKGRGLPGKPAGDQYVTLRIVTPPADSEAAKSAYRQLAEAAPFDPRQEA